MGKSSMEASSRSLRLIEAVTRHGQSSQTTKGEVVETGAGVVREAAREDEAADEGTAVRDLDPAADALGHVANARHLW